MTTTMTTTNEPRIVSGFEASVTPVNDSKWRYRVSVYRHGILLDDFWLKDDGELKSLAKELTDALARKE